MRKKAKRGKKKIDLSLEACPSCGQQFSTANRHSTGVLLERKVNINSVDTTAREIFLVLGYNCPNASRVCEKCHRRAVRTETLKSEYYKCIQELEQVIQAGSGIFKKVIFFIVINCSQKAV